MSRKITFFIGISLILSVNLAQAASKPVTWATPDGVRIVGIYSVPKEASGRVWILLHGLGSNKQEWLPFTRRLTAAGEGFLIYDARGHGDSNQMSNGRPIDYREFRTAGPGSQWDTMIADVGSAVQFLQGKESIPVKRIGLGGASLGANVAISYASEQTEIPAVFLLSPGLQYAGVTSEQPFKKFAPRPVFAAATRGDVYASMSVQQLAGMRSDFACKVIDAPGSAHGVNMLNDSFSKTLLEWMKQVK
jgi:alpha-beta hydrolase superfamily lysophospholipase